MADIVIDVRAYSKMLLHAMKYPHHSVNGIFLAEKRRNKEHGGSVNIVDSIPLFHLSLSLTPMLEVAMMQVEEYCKDHSLMIAGYYQANEHVKDSKKKPDYLAFDEPDILIDLFGAKYSSPDFIAYRIADKVYENFSDACLVMVDNQKMSLDCDDLAFHLYQFSDNKWRLKDKNSVHFEQGHRALSVTSALLHSKAYRKLNDFDNHLDDISADWSNACINQEMDRCL